MVAMNSFGAEVFKEAIEDYKKYVFQTGLRRFLIALLVFPAFQLLSSTLLPAYADDAALCR